MLKRIKLKFDPELKCLAGTEYGKQTYKDQVKGRISSNEKAIIEFPKEIKTVSSSFISGFLNALILDINIDSYKKYILFAGNDYVIDKFFYYL